MAALTAAATRPHRVAECWRYSTSTGSVADVRHRLHHLDHPKSWHRFFADAAEDGLLPEGARLVAELAEEHEIVWLTGRPEWLRRTTVDWLAEHGLPGDELHLRPHHDYRPARRYKRDVLFELSPRGIAAFIDDDEEVVDAALRAGFPAVHADWLPRNAIVARRPGATRPHVNRAAMIAIRSRCGNDHTLSLHEMYRYVPFRGEVTRAPG